MDLAFINKPIKRNSTIAINFPSARAHALAQPLFDIGLDHFSYKERINFSNLSKNPSNHTLIYIMLKGSIEFSFIDKTLVAKSGNIMVLPAGVPIKQQAKSKTVKFLYFQINPTTLWAPLQKKGPYIRSYQEKLLVTVLALRILYELRGDSLDNQQNCLEESSLLSKIMQREIQLCPDQLTPRNNLDALFFQIKNSLNDKWTLEKMADQMHLSTRTLNRLCNKHYHYSAIYMVNNLRVQKSIELLTRHNLSISQIASLTGFGNASAYSKAFLKHTGMRPGEFRTKTQSEVDALHWKLNEITSF